MKRVLPGRSREGREWKQYLLLLGCVLLLFNMPLSAQEETRIRGAADFLIERANENFIYIFEQRMKGNKLLPLYFPKTYQLLGKTDLRILLTSRDMWRLSVEQDLNQLVRTILRQLERESLIFRQSDTAFIDEFLAITQHTVIIINGTEYPLNSLPINAPEFIRNTINPIYDHYLQSIRDIQSALTRLNVERLANRDSLTAITHRLDSALASIDGYNSVFSSGEFQVTNLESLKRLTAGLQAFFDSTRQLLEPVQVAFDTSYSYPMRVANAFSIIEYISRNYSGSIYAKTDLPKIQARYYEQFKIFALFFAQLSEAQTADEVKAILKATTLPAVSFAVKRKPKERHFTIASYLGIATGVESTRENLGRGVLNYGLAAPVGLEFSWGRNSGSSISILGSIIDFGQAVNAQLYDTSAEITFRDIVNPGIYFIYGVKNVPLALGAGYFRGQSLREHTRSEHHLRLIIAFDMPLFILY